MQFGEVANQSVRVNGAARILTTARHPLAEQVALANQRQAALAVDKPVLGGANHQIAAVAGGFLQTQHMFWRNFNPRQHFAQRFTAAFAFHREDHRTGKGLEEAAQIIQRRFVLTPGRRGPAASGSRRLVFAALSARRSVFSCTRGHFFSSLNSSSLRSHSSSGGRSGRIGSTPRFSKRARASFWNRSALASRSPVLTISVLAGK